MNTHERQVIEGLFAKLDDVERQAGPRDPDAEAFIRTRMSAQPGAPYYMAQTIVVQEQALNAAQARIAELEQQVSRRPAGSGSLLSNLFGVGRMPQPGPTQRAASTAPNGPWSGGQPADGRGGFLAGAAQTAMGVAGGVLLGNMIAGAFSGGEAAAAEQPGDEADDMSGDAGLDEEDF
jgi:hypothetical protein